ncbi:beta-1,3-galactosyltransferase brn-like isoform X1 [Mytilus californianus]|uniref:beta-1,3-galactosyltransferase brn-like isoform X1 n=1 Tax=Mytilus californianus TaxID=6549 RepID=UPI00224760CA|nr:beta-1,3-galactosyltransferase brn-like isoform X1 [Mytilus californianus]
MFHYDLVFIKHQIQRNKKNILYFICISVIIIYLFNANNKKEFHHFDFVYSNLSSIIAEIEKTGTTSTQPLNNLTSSYRLLRNPRQKQCQSNSCLTVDIIYLVKSAVLNFSQRKAIRETWGKDGDIRIITIFILGYSESLQSFIETESIIHGDILQFDMQDIYDNLVYKTVFSIAWLCDSNINTKYVHFVDDDRIINSKNLLKLALNNLHQFEMKMIGYKANFEKPYRNKSSKWYISVTDYEFDVWPPYIIGGTMITNLQVIKTLREGIPFSRVIRIEDAYIGILARLLKISLEHNKNFTPFFISGYELINKISSPDYRSYDAMIREWKVFNSVRNHTIHNNGNTL